MFKVEQKVVYVSDEVANDLIIAPQKNEIVTVSGVSLLYKDSVFLYEYPFSLLGNRQSFNTRHLRPLDETFAESALENIKEQIKEEELVCV